MKDVLLLLLVVILVMVSCQEGQYTKLLTKQGPVKGLVEKARNGHFYVAYYGLPFAQPPVGQLRWRPPSPAGTWTDVRDATKSAPPCLQDDVRSMKLKGEEDCLYLNVFTKKGMQTDNGRLKPVLVYVHGGAFIYGSAHEGQGHYFMEEDVVLVVLQYRLHLFGFLSTEDQHASGNYGMMDQVEALRWVQSHIEEFGGDPDHVHVFGMSAGGASVHYLSLSPMAKGLFTNAISLSGSALCPWAYVPHPKEQANKLFKHFGCLSGGSSEQMDCLRNVSASDLARTHSKLFFYWRNEDVAREPMNSFSPRCDREAEQPFLPEPPIVSLALGHINPGAHLFGLTEKEGIFRANHLIPDSEEPSVIWKDFVSHFDTVAPLALGLHGGQTKDVGLLLSRIKKFYRLNELQQDELSDDKVSRFIDALSDAMFNFAIDETVRLRSQHGPTYLYYLTYTANSTRISPHPRAAMNLAGHGEDLALLFPDSSDPLSESDSQMSRRFIRMLVHFARHGRPEDDQWAPLNETHPVHMQLGHTFQLQSGLPNEERMSFWRSLPSVFWAYTSSVKKVTDSLIKDEL